MESTAVTLAAACRHLAWGPGAWWPIFPLLWIGLFVALFVFMGTRFRRGAPWHRPGVTAEGVLAERYARGEISDDEYRERLAVLKDRSS